MSNKMMAIIFFLSFKAWAVPTLYPKYFTRQLQNPTDSSLLFDSIDPSRIYVLPPANEVSRVNGLHSLNANVGFCGEIAKLQKYNSDIVDRLHSLFGKYTQNMLDVRVSASNIRAMERLASLIAAQNNLNELAALDQSIGSYNERLDALYVQIKNCSQNCDLIKSDIESMQKFRDELMQKRQDFLAAHLKGVQDYERYKAEADAAAEKTEALRQQTKQSYQDLMDVYNDFNHMFAAYALREGGRVSISFLSHWSENIHKLQLANSGLKFEKIAVVNAQMRTNGYTPNKLETEGALISFEISGARANGEVLSFGAYPESFSGNATLNLLGVCPLLHPDQYDIPAPSSTEQMHYNMMVSYQYPAAFSYDVTVRYNLYRMAKAVHEAGTSGGFFSTSNWDDSYEEQIMKDSFQVDWHVQDARQLLTEIQKQKIAADLRHQIMSRLAMNMIMNKVPQATPVHYSEDPKTGARILAGSLKEICPQSITCRAASMAFDILQSVFGSSSAESTIQQTYNVDMTEKYSSEQVVLQPAITAYN